MVGGGAARQLCNIPICILIESYIRSLKLVNSNDEKRVWRKNKANISRCRRGLVQTMRDSPVYAYLTGAY